MSFRLPSPAVFPAARLGPAFVLAALCCLPVAQALGPATRRPPTKSKILALIAGSAGRLDLVDAWRKPGAFVASTQESNARARFLDAAGRVLLEIPIDLGHLRTDFAVAGGKHLVRGDEVREGLVCALVKLPDPGAACTRIELVHRDKALGWKRQALLETAKVLELADSVRPFAAPTIKTHLNSGPVKNRYDIVVLGDGYQAAEITRFYADVSKWMTDLLAREPFKSHKAYFNIHSVFRASAQSGADHPDRNPPVYKNTAYDASYAIGGIGRCLYIKNGVQASKDAALAPDTEGRVVVFVNDSRYGGCGGTFSVSYNGASGSRVQSHEFGHSFGRLADEYDYGRSGTYAGGEPSSANITKDSTGKAKWPLWLNVPGVGAYQGAGYYRYGLYRPKRSCLMRTLGAPLCEVCIEQLTKQSYQSTKPIEAPVPSTTTVSITKPASRTFSFTNLVPGGGKVLWKIGSTTRQTGGNAFVLDSRTLSPGTHTLDLELSDTTPLVRKDPGRILAVSHRWSVRIVDVALPDLTITSFTAPASAAAGTTIALATVIRNAGQNTAPTCAVEHFLTQRLQVNASTDLYLGTAPVAALAGGKSLTINRSVTLPRFLAAGSYRIAAWVDRAGVLSEGRIDNNTNLRPLASTGPSGCAASLEFDKPLVYPHDRASISLAKGGYMQLRVTAPCAPNDVYLVLWSCTGTTPGQNLPGGHHLPLNFDPLCTTIGLGLVNQAPFFAFFAKLDRNGLGAPFLWVQPGYGFGPAQTHFAGVLFKSDLSAIAGATNAVRYDVLR